MFICLLFLLLNNCAMHELHMNRQLESYARLFPIMEVLLRQNPPARESPEEWFPEANLYSIAVQLNPIRL